MNENSKVSLSRIFTALFERLKRSLSGIVTVIKRTFLNFNDNFGPQSAASIAYYAIFSIFPLLLFIVAGASYFFEQYFEVEELFQVIENALPVAPDIIIGNIDSVLNQRGALGVIAIVGLLWSGSGIFYTLAININRAWGKSILRGPIQRRLIAFAMVGGLMGLLVLTLIATALIDILPPLLSPYIGEYQDFTSTVWNVITRIGPFLLRLLIFWLLYRWVPATYVKPLSAFWGALVASIGWDLITTGFTLYLSSGLARYDLIYGSLGSIVALLFWIYLSAYIVLIGAHLTASIDHPVQP